MLWRLLLTTPLPAADNMALDEALMNRARASGESILRVYEWEAPSLSLGRNQHARGLYDLDAARDAGIAIVRRRTGGRALLHHREITYSVAAPAVPHGSIRESYAWINRLLIDALMRLGVEVTVAAGGGLTAPPGPTPCFQHPSAGELVMEGRKLVGSAQWRNAGAMLQHGSILVDDDQPLAATLLVEPKPIPPRPATLREALGRAPDAAEMMQVLAAALRERQGGDIRPLQIDGQLAADAAQARVRYRSDEWTWRR